MRPRLSHPFSSLAWAFLCVFLLAACAKEKGSDPSNDHLKAGLLALDQGDENAAERELNASLAERPKNADARVALASIYAHRAGFPMKTWLDPLMAAGKQVDSKMHSYESAGRSFDGSDDENLTSADPKEQSLRELRDRIRAVYANLGKVATGMMVAIDLFEALPYLDEAQLGNLDRAIQVLRDEDSNPNDRSDKVKIYLAALSLMKFIHHLREFVGSFDHETKKMFTSSSRFCTMDAPEVRQRVNAIHDSLLLVEEGLRVSNSAPDNERTKARRKLHDFVSQRLLGTGWENVEKFFEKGSEQNYVVMRYASRICGVGKRPDINAEPAPIPGGPTGANLWNPDDDSPAQNAIPQPTSK
jgi:hypothetical protein